MEPDSRNFIMSGWKNQNEFLNIIDMGISNVLSGKMQLKIQNHQEDTTMHPLGKISLDAASSSYIGNKLLKRDLSNLRKMRKTTFFPNEVRKMEVDNSIIGGYFRKYDNGLMEYDIIFKFGSGEVET